jgi:hypothetical protein
MFRRILTRNSNTRKFSTNISNTPKTYIVELCTGIGSSLLANSVYSIMRAKDRGSSKTGTELDKYIRIFTFLTGFPFTMLPYICVKEGSNRVFGLDLKCLD